MGQNESDNQPPSAERVHANGGPKDPLIGQVLGGRFRVQSLIARGGMGKVYRAEQAPLNRPVALKILDPSASQDDEGTVFRERFFLEASTCAKLSHPNTVRIYDYGSTWDDVFYIAMEYLDGETLNRVVRQNGPLSPKRMISIAKQICGSLHEAHTHGMIHRDLKPSNVFLTGLGSEDEFAKVLDFGLVKNVLDDAEMTDAGRLLGSPMYMSPEQVRCETLDRRTDIYSLGMLMYVCLTGKRPFKKTQSIGVLLSQINELPPAFQKINPKISIPASLEWVVMRCLEKEASARFADMAELVRALKACELELAGDGTGPVQLMLEHGKTVLPDGLETLDSDDLAIEHRSAVAIDDSHTFQFETPESSDGKQKVVIAAGFGAAGIFFALAVLLVFVAAGIVTWGAIRDRSMERTFDEPAPQTSLEQRPTPVDVDVETSPDVPVEPQQELPKASSERPNVNASKINAARKSSGTRAKSGQKRQQSGTLRERPARDGSSPNKPVQDTPPAKEDPNWKKGTDIRDPWAGER